MTEKIHCNGWAWELEDASALDGWFYRFEKLEENPVKSNPVRVVFTAEDRRGHHYFVKHDRAVGFFGKIKALFRSKAKREYLAAKTLESKGVTTVKYIGWGRKGSEGMLLSLAAEHKVSAKEYWFAVTGGKRELKNAFLDRLDVFVRRMVECRFFHPDFHLGNILTDCDTGAIVLVDPYGVTARQRELDVREKTLMQKIYIEFRGELTPQEIYSHLVSAGLAGDEASAKKTWLEAVRQEDDEVEKGWAKRQRQILSGKSKFCSMIEVDDITIFVRHSIFYKPIFELDFPSVPTHLTAQKMPGDVARELWLESFRLQLLRLPLLQVPLIWARDASGNDIIYYATREEEKHACGF